MKKTIIFVFILMIVMMMCGCESINSSISNLFTDKGKVIICEYKGIKIAAEDYVKNITEEDVDEYINSLIQQNYTGTEVFDRPVQNGDTVNIDYEGLLNGVPFEGGTSTGHDLVIGSGKFIDGFEEGLIGAKKGQELSLNLTFPKEYHSSELAGKEVVFKVKVNSIIDNSIPELTDELATSLFGADNAEKFRAEITDQLNSSNETANYNAKLDIVWNHVLENSVVERYPKDTMDMYAEFMKSKYIKTASSYGMSLESFITNYYNISIDDFNAAAEKYSEEQTKSILIANEIAKRENLTIDDDDYQEGLEYFLTINGYSNDEEFIKDRGVGIEEYFGKEVIVDALTINIVREFVAERAIVK